LYFLRERPQRKDATKPTIETASPSPESSEVEYGGDNNSSILEAKDINVLIMKNMMIRRIMKFLFFTPSFTV